MYKIVNECFQKKCPPIIPESSSHPPQASSMCEIISDQYQKHDSEAHTDSQDGATMLYYRNKMCDDYKKLNEG